MIAGSDPVGAAGLTQILAETGRDFLGMAIDLQASRRLTRQIAAAASQGELARLDRLRARRRRIDARFNPAAALAATVRYLVTARRIFGRDDLAVVSYHMGIGNLEAVVHDYTALKRISRFAGWLRRRTFPGRVFTSTPRQSVTSQFGGGGWPGSETTRRPTTGVSWRRKRSCASSGRIR